MVDNSKSTNETTARANKRTMSAGMARAILGTEGRRDGYKGSSKSRHKLPSALLFTAFSGSPLERDRGLGMPLINA